MATATPKRGLIKPDVGERYSVATLNGNMDKLDNDPAIKVFGASAANGQVYMGSITLTKGAGGESPTAASATDGNGVGGIWLADLAGLTTPFKTITSVQLTHTQDHINFISSVSIRNVSTTRIKFQARRLDGSNWANNYGSITLYVMIAGTA